RRLMLETWPGTLALRLPRRRSLPSWAAQDEVATLLCPDGFCWRVAWAFGAPIAVVLAGVHGSAEARLPVHSPGVDLAVDGGPAVCAPAPILDLTTVRPRVASSGTLFAPQRLRRLVPDL